MALQCFIAPSLPLVHHRAQLRPARAARPCAIRCQTGDRPRRWLRSNARRAITLDWRAAQLEVSAPPAAPAASQELLSPRDVVLAALAAPPADAVAYCARGVVLPNVADVKVVEIAPSTDGSACVVEVGFVAEGGTGVNAATLELSLIDNAWRIVGLTDRKAPASMEFL